MAKKHPFHFDTYNKLYDSVTAILEKSDERFYPEVRTQLESVRQEIWAAWNLQCEIERSKGLRR
jgi:hypothetical protein